MTMNPRVCAANPIGAFGVVALVAAIIGLKMMDA